jgi:hypothetical protein
MLKIRCTFCGRIYFKKFVKLEEVYSEIPRKHHPNLAPMEVCEQKFPITQNFDLLPPQAAMNKHLCDIGVSL